MTTANKGAVVRFENQNASRLKWKAVGVLTLALSACHGSGALLDHATPGLPLERFFPSMTGVLPAVESRARRADTADGPQTDIWISGIALSTAQQKLFDSKAWSDTDLPALQAPGILIRVKDDGLKGADAIAVCAGAAAAVTCVPSDLGVVVITRQTDAHIQGALFVDSKEHDRRFVSQIDAPLTNASATPGADAEAWNDDGGKITAVFSKMMEAAAQKDVDALRALSMPAREHDWDHFGIISSAQRTAQQGPRIVAAYHKGLVAHLYAVTTDTQSAGRLPLRIDLESDGADWRFAQMIF